MTYLAHDGAERMRKGEREAVDDGLVDAERGAFVSFTAEIGKGRPEPRVPRWVV